MNKNYFSGKQALAVWALVLFFCVAHQTIVNAQSKKRLFGEKVGSSLTICALDSFLQSVMFRLYGYVGIPELKNFTILKRFFILPRHHLAFLTSACFLTVLQLLENETPNPPIATNNYSPPPQDIFTRTDACIFLLTRLSDVSITAASFTLLGHYIARFIEQECKKTNKNVKDLTDEDRLKIIRLISEKLYWKSILITYCIRIGTNQIFPFYYYLEHKHRGFTFRIPSITL